MRVYKSRIDWWVALALAVPLAAGLSATVGGFLMDLPAVSGGGVAALVLYAALVGGLVLPMRYTLGPQALEIRFGLARIRIPWERLVSARLSSNPLSSPALSLLRIEIEYRGRRGGLKTVRISPTDRIAFLRELPEVSPRHRQATDSVVLR